MKNKLRTALYAIAAIVFWIAVWQIIAYSVDLDFVFPKFAKTAAAFFALVTTSHFWLTVGASLLRILTGFAIGVLLGILLATITHHVPIINAIVAPAMTVIKSTPVASFILVLWCLIGKATVPTVISVLMVMPIVWENLTDGYKSVSSELMEVCRIFEVPKIKKFFVLIFPTLIKFLLPALVTSSALAWKSGVAAEIIVYAKNSIGKEITDAKNMFESEKMFAWTIAVVVLSILIEFVIKRLARTVKKI